MLLELSALTGFALISGALARRHWGGWGKSIKWVRGLAFFALGIAINTTAFAIYLGEGLSDKALLIGFLTGIIPQASLWFARGHGFAHGMGSVPNRPAALCIVVFLGNYAAALSMQGIILDAFEIQTHGAMAAFGFLTPLPHYLAARIDFGKIFGLKMMPADQGHFYDGFTVFGELGLGAVMFGSLPAALLLERLITGGQYALSIW